MKKRENVKSMHIMLVLSIILLTIYSKSWRDIPKYFKNMVFVSSFNGLYYLLCRRHLVWEFIPNGINWFLIRIAHSMVVTPLFVLIFLSKMPSTLFKKILHFIRWILVSSAVEHWIHKKKLILYAHGWNIFWSGVLYLKMFTYSYLFTKRPFLALFLSLYSTIFFIFKFKVPLRMKHFSRYFEPLVDLYYHTFLGDFFGRLRRKIF